MLTYDLSQRKKCSMYEYLYRCIKEDIVSGRLKPGEKLPSKRELAACHRISVKTVENAYEQLLTEGFLRAREKSGYFVKELLPVSRMPEPALAEGEYEGAFELGGYGQEEQYFADFTVNNTVYEKFPFSLWARVMREVLTEQDAGLLRTIPFQGVMRLRVAIAGYLHRFRGMQVSPACIIIGAGTEYLYGRLIQLLGGEARYALEDPGYYKIARIYEGWQANWGYVRNNGEGLDMRKLQELGANVVHVSPGHHFPLGTVMSVEKRKELLAWAGSQPNRYIIEDDYDCEFRYDAHPVPALKGMDREHRVIYMNTFSKTLAPSIRVSYMVLPPRLMKRYVESMNFYSCTVSGFEQYALAEFIEKGYFERHLNRMRHYYKGHRDRLRGILQENSLLPITGIDENVAGTHFLLRVAVEMNDVQLKWAAGQAGIHISCLSEYCHEKKPEYEHTILLNYSDMEEEVLREAIRRLGNIVREDACGDGWFL